MANGRRYADPTGDTESDAFPWVDIHAVSHGHTSGLLEVWVPGAPAVDPTEQWIAYGVVVDDDGDGVADRRFGMDNIPETAADGSRKRNWITDLHTGQTETWDSDESQFPAAPAGVPTQEAATPVPTRNCEEGPTEGGLQDAKFYFGGGDVAGGGSGSGHMPTLFYAWASVIVGGRVVATDYAPDAGWLHPFYNVDLP